MYGTAYDLSVWTGDIVKLKHASGRFTEDDRFSVIKVNPKNLRVRHIGTGDPLIGPHTLWEKVDAKTDPVTAAAKAVDAAQKIDMSVFKVGVVVTLADYSKRPKTWKYKEGQPLVVLSRTDRVKVVKLGGDVCTWTMDPRNLKIVEVD